MTDRKSSNIVFETRDIIQTIHNMKSRGVEFISIPDTHYEDLRAQLNTTNLDLNEDIDKIKRLGILVDSDSQGYLLQLFTKPLTDRPTIFIGIIMTMDLGPATFKSLFEAIERERDLRGNL